MRPEEAAGTRESWDDAVPDPFDAHAMDHIPDEDMPAVVNASLAVVQEAINAGVWVFGGGLKTRRRASWPPTERSPTARTRRPSADSVSSTCPHARRR